MADFSLINTIATGAQRNAERIQENLQKLRDDGNALRPSLQSGFDLRYLRGSDQPGTLVKSGQSTFDLTAGGGTVNFDMNGDTLFPTATLGIGQTVVWFAEPARTTLQSVGNAWISINPYTKGVRMSYRNDNAYPLYPRVYWIATGY